MPSVDTKQKYYRLIAWGCALASMVFWFVLSYPELTITNISIDRAKARAIAKAYVATHVPDVTSYQSALRLSFDNDASHYLQKTLGFERFTAFIHAHGFDMFRWTVRFFKEGQKEEFQVVISSATGQITSYHHTVDDTAARKMISRREARQRAETFLNTTFGIDVSRGYILRGDLEQAFDNRSDFIFTWAEEHVQIPWSAQAEGGTAKLLFSVTITGDEVRAFSKNSFSVPDEFNRDVQRRSEAGRNLLMIVRIFYSGLFIASIFFLVSRPNHISMHLTKPFYVTLASCSFLLSLLANYNGLDDIFFGYPTTAQLDSFLVRQGIAMAINALFVTFALLMPSLSGESLHFEVFRDKQKGSFLYYVRSTFLSRGVARALLAGYYICIIMLGIQAVLIALGKQYLGVWTQHSLEVNISSAYFPFLAAFTFAIKTSISEEIMHRLFAISLWKRFFKSTPLAIILSSLIWGFAHSGYPVFPMWFRSLEVTCLGIFLGVMYLRHGILAVIVGHYLFDVFWSTTGYLFGKSTIPYFTSALGLIVLPLLWAIVAWCVNKKEELAPLRWKLTTHQQFNLGVLTGFVTAHPALRSPTQAAALKNEIIRHGWDPAVVDMAFESTADAPAQKPAQE